MFCKHEEYKETIRFMINNLYIFNSFLLTRMKDEICFMEIMSKASLDQFFIPHLSDLLVHLFIY